MYFLFQIEMICQIIQCFHIDEEISCAWFIFEKNLENFVVVLCLYVENVLFVFKFDKLSVECILNNK